MTRINRPDTLLSELREIKRRLRLLEAARMRPATATAAAPAPAPVDPARTTTGVDPATTTAGPARTTAGVDPATSTAGVDPATSTAEQPAGGSQPTGSVRAPLLPARPRDWPASTAPEWERLAVGWLEPGTASARLTVLVAADTGTAGAVRVLADGEPVADAVPATDAVTRHVVPVPDATGEVSEIAVEARRTEGDGSVRVTAALGW